MDAKPIPILDYASPQRTSFSDRILLTVCFIPVIVLPMFAPRMHPCRWPTTIDQIAIIALPLEAIVLSLSTKLPYRFLIYFGFFGSCFIQMQETSDTFALGMTLTDETRANAVWTRWVLFILGNTLFCWATVLLRLLKRIRTK